MIKQLLKILLPKTFFLKIEDKWRIYKVKRTFKDAYFYDLNRYLGYSDSTSQKSESNLISLIIRRYHVIEKGLTMPETRLGFGQKVLTDLISDCQKYIDSFNFDEPQLLQAVSVLKEYKEFHHVNSYTLDSDLLSSIDKIVSMVQLGGDTVHVNNQKEFSRELFFSSVNASFPEFSKSRSSIRNYSDNEVSLDNIIRALDLAKYAPSACNRQAWRTYVITDRNMIKRILETQGGNRGFGHLTNKLIVIAAETSVFSGVSERNQAFIDGGIYAMNLLYSLHFHKVAACILNCSNNLEKDRKLRDLTKIKDSEVFIALVSCGIPPNTFKAAASIRYSLNITNKVYE